MLVSAAAGAAGSREGVLVLASTVSLRVCVCGTLSGARVAVMVGPAVTAGVVMETVMIVASSLSVVDAAAVGAAGSGV